MIKFQLNIFIDDHIRDWNTLSIVVDIAKIVVFPAQVAFKTRLCNVLATRLYKLFFCRDTNSWDPSGILVPLKRNFCWDWQGNDSSACTWKEAGKLRKIKRMCHDTFHSWTLRRTRAKSWQQWNLRRLCCSSKLWTAPPLRSTFVPGSRDNSFKLHRHRPPNSLQFEIRFAYASTRPKQFTVGVLTVFKCVRLSLGWCLDKGGQGRRTRRKEGGPGRTMQT